MILVKTTLAASLLAAVHAAPHFHENAPVQDPAPPCTDWPQTWCAFGRLRHLPHLGRALRRRASACREALRRGTQ